jgi:hypothetical protein
MTERAVMAHLAELTKILLDLDRCAHGRHSSDPCFGCPDGVSAGNPHLTPGAVIGYGLDGTPIRMPDRRRGEHPYDVESWRTMPS